MNERTTKTKTASRAGLVPGWLARIAIAALVMLFVLVATAAPAR